MDQHVPRAISVGLRLRGVDVVTAFEDGASEMNDSELLNRASELGRVLFTRTMTFSSRLPHDRRMGDFLMV